MKNSIILKAYGYEAEILPERGANLIRLARPEKGMDVLRTPYDSDTFLNENPYLWGVPILFPPNRISDARFMFEGREYVFPMNEPEIHNFCHGEIHEKPFDVVMADATKAVLRYTASAEKPYMGFPHAFTLEVCYELRGDGLHQTVSVSNDSEQDMPVALGYHTTFRVPFVENGRAEEVRLMLSVGREIVRDMTNYLPTGELLDPCEWHDELTGTGLTPCHKTISRHYEMVQPARMTLKDVRNGACVIYEPDEHYRYWMVYNGGAQDYLCVEPQTWINNCPNAPFDRDKTGFSFLKPGECRAYHATLRLERP